MNQTFLSVSLFSVHSSDGDPSSPTNAAVCAKAVRLPYSISFRDISVGEAAHFTASRNGQCWSKCSPVFWAVSQEHIPVVFACGVMNFVSS